MQFADGIAAGVALAGFLYAVVRYARFRERDSLAIAVASGMVGIVATVAAFAHHVPMALAPVPWAAAALAGAVVVRERRRRT